MCAELLSHFLRQACFNMSRWKGLLLSISSGVPFRDRFDQNDGSISGCIFLVSFIALSCCAVFVSSSRDKNNTFSMTSHGNAYLIFLCMLTILACFLIKCVHARSTTALSRVRLRNHENTVWIKMKFLYLFGIAGIFYKIIAWIDRHNCSQSKIVSENFVAVRVVLILFFAVQTGFIRIMFHFVMAARKLIIYSLGFILVTNVAVWTITPSMYFIL